MKRKTSSITKQKMESIRSEIGSYLYEIRLLEIRLMLASGVLNQVILGTVDQLGKGLWNSKSTLARDIACALDKLKINS